MTRVLVTGAGGFVGRVACEALARRDFEVHGVGRAARGPTHTHAWHRADILEDGAIEHVLRTVRPSHALHLAWTTAHGQYWEDPANELWVSATRRFVDAFAESGGSRFVFAGSCAQYEWTSAAELSESESPRRAATAYGRAKEATAKMIESAAQERGLSAATALLFFPYGPNEPRERLVPSVAQRVLSGREAPVSSGTQVRDFIHVADCAAALAALASTTVCGCLNVGTGKGTSVAEVAGLVARLAGRPELLQVGALPGADESRVVAAVDRLRDEVGFRPRFSLEEGLQDAVEWWRSAQAA